MATFNFKSSNDKAFFKSFESVLGGSRFIESNQNTDFGNWSPNAVRDIVIGNNVIAVRWFEGIAKGDSDWTTGTYSAVPDSSDVVNRVLSSKRFANIETLYVAPDMNFDPQRFFNRQMPSSTNNQDSQYDLDIEDNSTNIGWGNIHGVDGDTRLREVGILNIPAQVAISNLNKGLPVICSQVLTGHSGDSYKNCFSLNSSYKPDSKGGVLNTYLVNKQTTTSDVETSTSTDSTKESTSIDDSDTLSNIDIEEDAKYSDLLDRAEGIYDSLKTPPSKNATSDEVTEDTPTVTNTDTRGIKNLLAFILTPDARVRTGKGISVHILKPYADRTKKYQARASQIGTKHTEEGEGFYGLKSVSVLQSVVSNCKSLDLDVQPGGSATEYYTRVLDAIESATKPKDDTKELVVSVLGSRIGSIVNNILKEYDDVFSAGYELSRPEAVLAGVNKIYTTAQGGSVTGKNNTIPEFAWLWNSLSTLMGINPKNICFELDLNEIAKSPTGSYFPELMARFAYGYKPKSHGGKVSGSWESYKTQYLKPALEDIITNLYVDSIKADNPNPDIDYLTNKGFKIVESVADPLRESLLRVLMVSDFKTVGSGTERKIVSATIKILSPEPLDADDVENAVRTAFGKSADDPALSGARLITTPSETGNFVEIIVILDNKLDNATPIFAYKALESLVKNGADISSINLFNAVLGIDPKGHIVRAGDKIDFMKKVTHFVGARSRAGKGVMTMAFLVAILASKNSSMLAYSDNKPDIASLLLHVNPNAFVINGSNITSDAAGGNDIFGVFANGAADSWVNWDNVPDYLVTDKIISNKDYSSVGDFFYLRYMELVMSMIAVRTIGPKYRGILGGDAGITAVFDEYKNASENIANKFAGYASAGQVAGSATARAVQADRNKGKESEEDILESNNIAPGNYWVAAMLDKLSESANTIQNLKNAGGNDEKRINNLFILGQSKVVVDELQFVGSVQPQVTGKAAPINAKSVQNMLLGMDIFGGLDAFLGYSEPEDDFLLQYNSQTHYAHNLLNAEARNFAYVSDIEGGSGAYLYGNINNKGTRQDKIDFSNRQQYFKPFLVLEDSSMGSYPVRNLLNNVSSVVGPDKAKEVVAQNSEDGTTFSDGISFLGYLNKAGMTQDMLSAKLQRDSDNATKFVQLLGYPGTWRDFVFDLRPEWIFSVADVRNAFSKGMISSDDQIAATFNSRSRVSRPMGDMAKVFPDTVPAILNMLGGASESAYDEELPTDSQFGSSFINEEDDTVPPQEVDDPEDEVGIDPEEIDEPTVDASPNELVAYITSLIIANSRGKQISVRGNRVMAGARTIGEDKTATPQNYINWETVLHTARPTEIRVSKQYVNDKIAPALGWQNGSATSFFKENRYLENVIIDGKSYTRDEPKTMEFPVVTPQQTPPSYPPVSASSVDPVAPEIQTEVETPSRQSQISKSKAPGTLNRLFSHGGDKIKNSWHNGGIAKKAAGVGLIAAGANVITGGMVGSVLTAAICSPFAIPIAGIGWGIYLLTSNHRKRP
jgi:hypothetical protein